MGGARATRAAERGRTFHVDQKLTYLRPPRAQASAPRSTFGGVADAGDDARRTYPDRVGVTSRITRAPGVMREWRIDDVRSFSLPVVVDLMDVDPHTHEPVWRIAATVDLVDERPTLVHVEVLGPSGLDLTRLQREFRWATPLEIVTSMVPHLLAEGVDPLAYHLPTSGFPDAVDLRRRSAARLSDEFLEEVAREYLAHGRGYAAAAAAARHVSPRTVTSWIEKARRRGILTEVPRGSFGGNITSHADPD